MNRQVDKTNLGYLGSEYQYKLVKCFMEDTNFFQELYTIIDQNTFTEPLLRQFVGTLKDEYSNRGLVPSYSIILMVLKQKCRLESEIEEWEQVVKSLQEKSSEGWDIIKENATRFFKQQNMIRVANEIIKKSSEGDVESYNECLRMMEKVLTIGQDCDPEFNPYDVEDEVMKPNANRPVPTGIKLLDEALNGGLDKKKLGIVIGSAGFGKTSYSTAIASHAATCKNEANNQKGYKVIQICFEDDPKDIAKKHFSRISQIEAKDLTKNQNIEEARRCIDEFEERELFRDNLIIKKYHPNTKSVKDIENYIKRKINAGFKPDLLIVDYFEPIKKIRTSKGDSKWDLEENCMRELECLAEDYDLALWVMTQGNKESFTASVVNMAQAGGSVTKVQIGHVILSIARTLEDQANNRAKLTILKSRQGGSGCSWDCTFNNGTSTIVCDESIEVNSVMSVNDIYETQENNMRNMGQNYVNQQMTQQRQFHSGEQVMNPSGNTYGIPKKTVNNNGYFPQGQQSGGDQWGY